ncbi:MAG: GntR family transcriptional regulator [Bacillota bacterium]|jgi:DNA-binding transcriptional MocR family regulator|nr:GntR family transcriptional regulator [Bacillota bacterium]
MDIIINHHAHTPIYMQIVNQLKEMILKGEITDGFVLPSERTMAKLLKVHRNTVVRAYMELKAEAFLSSSQGKGYRVAYLSDSEKTSPQIEEKGSTIAWTSLIRDEYLDLKITFDDLFSKSYSSNNISFAGGIASAEEYGKEDLASILGDIISSDNIETYSFTPYQGNHDLRQNIAHFMSGKGISAKPSEIQIVLETNQALDYLASLLIKPGDTVITEEPVSPDVYRTFALAGGKVITVPMDEEGILCDRLEPLIIKHHPKFIYVNPDFQNPTGIVMSLERRKALLALSHKYRLPIIEEDASSEIRFEGIRIPSIKALDRGNNVIFIYSFALTFAPGVRMAFVLADKMLIKSLSYIVSIRLISLDSISQKLLSSCIEKGIYQKNLRTICADYKEKRDLMCACLEEAKTMGLRFRKPTGGVYLWCRLSSNTDYHKLYVKTLEKGVSFIPGSVFYLRGSKGDCCIRLNFSYPSKLQIEKGIGLLTQALRESKLSEPGICESELELES